MGTRMTRIQRSHYYQTEFLKNNPIRLYITFYKKYLLHTSGHPSYFFSSLFFSLKPICSKMTGIGSELPCLPPVLSLKLHCV